MEVSTEIWTHDLAQQIEFCRNFCGISYIKNPNVSDIKLSQIIEALRFQLLESSPLVQRLQTSYDEAQQKLQNEYDFLSAANKHSKVKLFSPKIESKTGKYAFVAVGLNHEIFIQSTTDDLISEVSQQFYRDELNELLTLTDETFLDLNSILSEKWSQIELLKFGDLLETNWEKIAVSLDMGRNIVHGIKTSSIYSTSYDKAVEFLNKVYQRHCREVTGKWILINFAPLLEESELKELFEILKIDDYLNQKQQILDWAHKCK